MKLLPILLMNVVLVTGGIVIYDQIRSDAPETTYVTNDKGPDLLPPGPEAGRPGDPPPLLRAQGVDPRLLARLEALEKRLNVEPAGPADTPTEGETEAPGGMAAPELPIDEEKPSEDSVRRFKRMMEAAQQMQRDERERERLQRTLERLELNLSEEQTDKLFSATREYRRKIGDVWRTAFRGNQGGDREQMREAARQGMETVREEFAVTINKFLPTGDAQKIVENAGQLGMRGFGGDMGGGRRAPRPARPVGGGGR